MKRKRNITLLTVCFLLAGSLSAQHATRDFIYLTANTGYSSLSRPQSAYKVTCPGGINDGIGLGFQMHHNHFTFSIGAEYYNNILSNVSAEEIHEVPKGMTEILHDINLNIPILIGGEFGKFYFKTGILPSFNLYGEGIVVGPAFNDHSVVWDTKDMISVRYNHTFQLFGRFELGGAFGTFTPFDYPIQPRARFYLGGYVDFGFLNYKVKQYQGSYSDKIPYVACNEAADDKVFPFSVGLRFSCLFNVSK